MFNEKFFPHDLGQCKNSRKFLCSTATLFCCHYIHNFSSPHLLLFHNLSLLISILLKISEANHFECNLYKLKKHTMTLTLKKALKLAKSRKNQWHPRNEF